MVRGPLVAVRALPAMLLVATPAFAGREAFVGTYEAPQGCPGQSAFEDRILARLGPRPRLGTKKYGTARLDVRIESVPGRWRARLDVHDAVAKVTTREFVAATCDEAVDGLALIAALALGSEQSRSPSAPVEEPQTPARVARPPSATPRIRGELVSSALALSGAAPEVVPGVGFALGAGADVTPKAALVLRGGLQLALPQTVHTADGNATFRWWSTFLALCARTSPRSSSLSLSACAAFEWGRLNAVGSETRRPAASSRPWVAVGPTVAAEWIVLRPLVLRLGLGGLIPLLRDRFLLGQTAAFTTDSVAFRADLGLGVRFE